SSAANYTNLYHNTINISGTPTGGAYDSYCYYTNLASVHAFTNNIFVNTRSNGGSATGKNVAVGVRNNASNNNNTFTNNDYYAPGTAGYVGNNAGGFYQTLAAWKTKMGAYEIGGMNINPVFTNSVGTTALSYEPSDLTLFGVSGTGVTT
ncbi:MAG: hypothetical protein WC341_07565, partial [Bacteroidales bacterium]